MLEYLHLKNVGPAPEMEVELAPRLNLITGDNGLGKSFLLDVAWWALTRRWPHDLNPRLTSGYAARPTDPRREASIRFRLQSKHTGVEYESVYVPRDDVTSTGNGASSPAPSPVAGTERAGGAPPEGPPSVAHPSGRASSSSNTGHMVAFVTGAPNHPPV